MPIYEYRCEQCGDFEESQRITDPPLERCAKCRRKVRRLISSTSFQLKGGGWYATGYGHGGGGDGAKKEPAGESSTSAAAESKADAKAESKGDSKTESTVESKPAPASEKPSS